MKISFVIPAYNECETLSALIEGIHEHAADHDHSICIVDDGSTDKTPGVCAEITAHDDSVHIIRFPENKGKSAALAAGFARAEGELVITMDADLQDDPKEIPRFIEAVEKGADLVCGWKAQRRDPWHKTVPSRVYNGFVSRIFGLALHDVNCGYRAMRLEVVKDLVLYEGMHRLIPIVAAHNGFAVTEITVEHHPRRHGTSKYGWSRFPRGAWDVMRLWLALRKQPAK